jgi:hypothetical protein
MATLITPSVIASAALPTLYNTIVLAGLVSRDYDSDFSGKAGDTITVRKPATFSVDEFDRADGIQLQDPSEGSFTVSLDTIPDVSFPVTTEELTLEVDQFRERLLTPAMEAIAQYLDGKLAETLIDAAEGVGGGGTASATGSTPENAAFREARAKLSRAKLPLTGRYAVLSPEATAEVLGDELIVAVDKSGSPLALREGIIGRLFGIESYESQVLGYGAGDAGQADGVAFHRSAIALVTRTLEKPMGLADSQVAVENYKGLGLRVVYDYDVDKKQDIVSVDFLYGRKAVRPEGAVQLNFGLGS